MKPKLRAFTLFELLVGMIISAVVIAGCYTGYSIAYKRYLSYCTIKREITGVVQLNAILNREFFNAVSVNYEENALIFDSPGAAPLRYEFDEYFILRQEGEITDTFNCSGSNFVPEYLETEHLSTPLLTGFSFDLTLYGEILHLSFEKQYTSEMIMNQQQL